MIQTDDYKGFQDFKIGSKYSEIEVFLSIICHSSLKNKDGGIQDSNKKIDVYLFFSFLASFFFCISLFLQNKQTN